MKLHTIFRRKIWSTFFWIIWRYTEWIPLIILTQTWRCTGVMTVSVNIKRPLARQIRDIHALPKCIQFFHGLRHIVRRLSPRRRINPRLSWEEQIPLRRWHRRSRLSNRRTAHRPRRWPHIMVGPAGVTNKTTGASGGRYSAGGTVRSSGGSCIGVTIAVRVLNSASTWTRSTSSSTCAGKRATPWPMTIDEASGDGNSLSKSESKSGVTPNSGQI